MIFFKTLAAVFGAAEKAVQPTHRGAHRAPGEGPECTPCAANAYAEQAAEQARALLGGERKQARARRR